MQIVKPLTAMFIVIMAPSMAKANGCVGVPRHVDSPPVMVCESASDYHFDLAGTKSSYDKEWFRSQLARVLGDWLRSVKVDDGALIGADVDFWLSVPESNPSGAQARAVLSSTVGDIVIYLDVDPNQWRVDSDQVGLLLDLDYPDSYGVTAGKLLVKAHPGVTEAHLQNFLAGHDATLVENFTGNWWVVSVPVFEETRVRDTIESDLSFPLLLEKVQYNYLYEWIAWREDVFGFELPMESKP